jgi:hypothetical protein
MSLVELMAQSPNLSKDMDINMTYTVCLLNEWLTKVPIKTEREGELSVTAQDLNKLTQMQKLTILRGGLSQPCEKKEITSLKSTHFLVLDSILQDQI